MDIRHRSSSDLPLHHPQQTNKPESKGKFRSASVSSFEGTSYVSSSSGNSRVLTTALSDRDVRHVAVVRLCVKLASVFASRSSKCRSYVETRSQALVKKMLQNNDPASREIAHKLIDNLGKHQQGHNELLADWRCNAYSQLGQQYAETGDTESLARIANQLEAGLPNCSSSHSTHVRSGIANCYMQLAGQYMAQGTVAGNRQAGHYVANAGRFSDDLHITEWSLDQATALLSPISSTSTPEAHDAAVEFIKRFQEHCNSPQAARSLLHPYKTSLAPTMFATEHLNDDKTVTLIADNSLPGRAVVYGRDSQKLSKRIEQASGSAGKVQEDDNAYKELTFPSAGSMTLMATEPVSQEEASRVAQKKLNEKAGIGDVTTPPSTATEYIMQQLRPEETGRILFCTDLDAPSQNARQWQSDLQNFAVALGCEPHNKQTYWSKVRFFINCDRSYPSAEIGIRRQGIMNDVNQLLAPMGIQLDESHFVMTADNPSDLPEAYRQDFQSQFAPPPSPLTDS